MVVGLVVIVMAALALPLGPLLKSMPPLRAYAIDISGSLTGIATFAVLSAFQTNPGVWFTVAIVLAVVLDVGRGFSRWSYVNAAVFGIVLFLVVSHIRGAGEIWSAYYRIDTVEVQYGADCNNMTLEHILVDGIPHQALHPVGQPCLEPIYTQVYRWFPDRTFNNVLVVGAGNGSDVALALAHGANHVDAVEIDPALMQIGIDQHPDHPYQDPRVSRYINDGRAFLRTTPDTTKYDLIIFALPDSLTLVSSQSAIRLESFLFTEEAFTSARDHLSSNGIFVLYNYYREDWLIAKLDSMLNDSFGTPPLVNIASSTQATLADGPLVASLPNGVPPADTVTPIPDVGAPAPAPATDDWPFLYLRTPFIADYYLAALAIVLLSALAAVAVAARVTGTTIRRFSPHFFVLGSAFLLLTTRSVVSFSLLFGTTWFVNALTFFAILASVLLAILINARWPIRRPTPFYILLFISIALAYLLPPESLLFDPIWLRYIVAAGVAFAPVFFANLVFSYSFRDTATADMAFASNLLGAMVGGALEYVALISGYRFLLVIVAVLYALAWLFASRLRLAADTELAREEADEPIPAPLAEAEGTI
jgi:hypothetical protein